MATALADYRERVRLAELLAAWHAETPESAEIHQQVSTELVPAS